MILTMTTTAFLTMMTLAQSIPILPVSDLPAPTQMATVLLTGLIPTQTRTTTVSLMIKMMTMMATAFLTFLMLMQTRTEMES